MINTTVRWGFLNLFSLLFRALKQDHCRKENYSHQRTLIYMLVNICVSFVEKIAVLRLMNLFDCAAIRKTHKKKKIRKKWRKKIRLWLLVIKNYVSICKNKKERVSGKMWYWYTEEVQYIRSKYFKPFLIQIYTVPKLN